MAWLKVDDGTWSAPWAVNVGDEALGVWTRLSSYSAQHLTDGLVPAGIVAMIGASDAVLDALEAHGKLQRRESGSVFLPDYLDENPSRAQVESDREQRKLKASRAAQARWGANGKR